MAVSAYTLVQTLTSSVSGREGNGFDSQTLSGTLTRTRSRRWHFAGLANVFIANEIIACLGKTANLYKPHRCHLVWRSEHNTCSSYMHCKGNFLCR